MKKMLCLVIVSYVGFMILGMRVAARDIVVAENDSVNFGYVEKGY